LDAEKMMGAAGRLLNADMPAGGIVEQPARK